MGSFFPQLPHLKNGGKYSTFFTWFCGTKEKVCSAPRTMTNTWWTLSQCQSPSPFSFPFLALSGFSLWARWHPHPQRLTLPSSPPSQWKSVSENEGPGRTVVVAEQASLNSPSTGKVVGQWNAGVLKNSKAIFLRATRYQSSPKKQHESQWTF